MAEDPLQIQRESYLGAGVADKIFAAVHGYIHKNGDWVGADLNDRILGETPVALYHTLTDEGPPFSLPMYDDLAQATKQSRLEGVDLRVQLEHFSPLDKVQVELDTEMLGRSEVRNTAHEDPLDPSDVADTSWLVWKLDAEKITYGPHQVHICLLKSQPQIKPPLVVRHVEIHVNYA